MTKGEQARLTAWRSRVLQAAAGEPVAWVCRRFGISRKSFYKWKHRHAEHGDAGLADRPSTTSLRRSPCILIGHRLDDERIGGNRARRTRSAGTKCLLRLVPRRR